MLKFNMGYLYCPYLVRLFCLKIILVEFCKTVHAAGVVRCKWMFITYTTCWCTDVNKMAITFINAKDYNSLSVIQHIMNYSINYKVYGKILETVYTLTYLTFIIKTCSILIKLYYIKCIIIHLSLAFAFTFGPFTNFTDLKLPVIINRIVLNLVPNSVLLI